MTAGARQSLEQALDAVEALIVADEARIELHAERGRLLAELGRTELAKAAYLEVLRQDPTHFATLNDLGALLYETNFRAAARTVFTQAVTHHPREPLGHVNLANLLMYADELPAAREHFETALRLDPANAAAHQGLSALLQDLGEAEAAQRHRRLGFGAAPLRTYPCLGDREPVPLLVLTSTPGGDIAWRKLVDDRVFAVATVAAAYLDPATPLPPHRLIFNAIGDADISRPDLLAAQALVARSAAPVINNPAKVLMTGRAANAERLRGLPGVVTPRTVVLPRAVFEGHDIEAVLTEFGFDYPLLLRSPGFHTGRHFSRVDRPDALAAAAAALPGPELVVIQYLNARGADGFARKYRVMMIDGELHPLHLAMSADWKVHYATGAMPGQAGFQAEEAEFLERMPQVLGERGLTALREIQRTLGLDYGGVDFGLSAAGEVLVFEANAVMNIIAPDASAEWDYRRGAVDRALQAARSMLISRSADTSAGPRHRGLATGTGR